MNIYYLERTCPIDYDEYDSMVVIAEDESSARKIARAKAVGPSEYRSEDWKNEDVVVILIGTAVDLVGARVVCASFNAG